MRNGNLLQGDEYGDTYLVLTGVNENQRENIEVALERKDLAFMGKMQDGEKNISGKPEKLSQRNIEFNPEKGKIRARELSAIMNL